MLVKYADQGYGVRSCGISQAFCPRLYTQEARVTSHDILGGTCGGQTALEQDFLRMVRGFSCHLSFPRCSTFIRQTGEGTIGSLEAAVPRDRLKIPGE